jgi:chemotaxis protein methyltransferase CheR
LDRAEESLRALVSAPRADGRALALLARICADQGRLATAQDWIDQAIAADELNATYHHLRATILQEQGASAAALVAFRRALYLDPQLVMPHVAIGHLLTRQGRAAEAARHFAQARALLAGYQPEDVLPDAAGLTAGHLAAILTGKDSTP